MLTREWSWGALLFLAGASLCFGQASVDVRVDLEKSRGSLAPVYSWFGYDESNYTTTENGKALLGELQALTPAPVYVRAHFLLTSGDGKPELKWSSSNVYGEDVSGKPTYNWAILDGIFDGWVHAGIRPFVELGFMPKALSTHPDPYHIPWPTKPGDVEGWSFPPKDYSKWQELMRQVAAHMLARYGLSEVSKWYWEVWNEPDIFYWHGTEQEYERLYDYAAAGVRAAIPDARVGGPATTGPTPGSKSAEYLREFLRHCAEDRSAATGGTVPLDFISFHAKGSPHIVDGHVQMGLGHELENAAAGFEIIRNSARFRNLPVVLSEADPEGCGACSPAQHPEDAYRNGTVYPAYTAAAMKGLLELAERDHIDLAGFVTWAFEFEGQPLFVGQRALATHGVDKPLINFFRMAGLLDGERVRADKQSALFPRRRLSPLVFGNRRKSMVWRRGVTTVPAFCSGTIRMTMFLEAPIPVRVAIGGIPPGANRVLMEEFRIDQQHSNAFEAWKQMGSPAEPNAEQYARLRAAGQLQLEGSPLWVKVAEGRVQANIDLPRESVDLLRVSWASQ